MKEGINVIRNLVRLFAAFLYQVRELLTDLMLPDPAHIPLDAAFPKMLGIEVTNVCNANCVFCGYQFRKRPAAFMPFETFQMVCKQYVRAGGGGIDLTPIVGEPLLDKGLVDKIAYAHEFPEITSIQLFTNGLLMSRRLFDALVDAGLTSVTVSLSSFDAKEYERVYRNSGYEKIISNLHSIAASDRFKKCKIGISLRTESLFPWLKLEFVRLRLLGFQFTRLVLFDNWSGRIKQQHLGRYMFLRPKRLNKKIPCDVLYGGPRGPMVLANGQITACGCRDLDGTSELVVGNISEIGLKECWTNGEIKALRRRFIDGNLPDICKDCTFYNPVKLERLNFHSISKEFDQKNH